MVKGGKRKKIINHQLCLINRIKKMNYYANKYFMSITRLDFTEFHIIVRTRWRFDLSNGMTLAKMLFGEVFATEMTNLTPVEEALFDFLPVLDVKFKKSDLNLYLEE